MADHYQLEDGSGNYQLEDASGSYLLEEQSSPTTGCVRVVLVARPARIAVSVDAHEIPATIVDDSDAPGWTGRNDLIIRNEVSTSADEGAPLGGFRLDDDGYAWQVAALPAPSVFQPPTDQADEWVATASPFGLDADGWTWIQPSPVTMAQPLGWWSDEIQFLGTGSTTGYPRTMVMDRLRRPSLVDGADELVVAATPFGLTDDYYQPTTYLPFVPVQPRTDPSDELAIAAAPFGLDGDGWSDVRPSLRPFPISFYLFEFDDATNPLFWLDDDQWTAHRPVPLPWNRDVAAFQDDLAITASPFGLEADPWADNRPSTMPCSRDVVSYGDEYGTPFGLADDDYTPTAFILFVPIQPRTDHCEELPTTVAPFGLDIDPWHMPGYVSLPTSRQVVMEADQWAAPFGLREEYDVIPGTSILYRVRPTPPLCASVDDGEWVPPPTVVSIRLTAISGSVPGAAAVTGGKPGLSQTSGRMPTLESVSGLH